MSLVEILPQYYTLSKDSPLRQKIEKAYRWYSPAFSPHDIPRFADLGSITEDPEVMRGIRDFFVQRYKSLAEPITHVLGFDSRGFVFGSMIAVELNVPFVLLRKAGKTPGVIVRSEPYEKEYAAAVEEYMTIPLRSLHKGARVVLIDDVIATGGTMLSGVQLVDACGGTVVEVAGLLGLTFLDGAQPVRKYGGGAYSNLPFVALVDETVFHEGNCGDAPDHKGPRVLTCAEAKKLI